MKISLNWLKDFIDTSYSDQELVDTLTMSGLEVEGVEKYEQIKGGLEGLVIGEVLTCDKHPNADKLKVTTVDVGKNEPLLIVCGAPNVNVGQKVVVATVNTMIYPISGESFKIKKSKIRGEYSEGMICAEDEIGIGESHDGIMILDTTLPNGSAAKEYFQIESDTVIEIGLTPNRADATSHLGVARDLHVLSGKPITLPKNESFSAGNGLPISVKVEDTDACPRYSGLTISGVKIAPSPSWLQNRLKSIGLSPTNNVVDITNYVLHDMGQPLHAFDMSEISGNKVIVKTLNSGTVFTTLDGQERKLADKDLMICNEKEGMCIAGVFGGIKSGVKESTTDIFLESAYFSPEYIRKTAQYHGLKTDASFRFERGTDPNITIEALKRAAILITEIAGGSVSSEVIDIYPNKIDPFEIDVKYKNINRLIGKDLSKDFILDTLQKLEIHIKDKTEDGFKALVPPYRVDVTREADIIEEILRIYGFDKIPLSNTLKTNYLAEHASVDKSKKQLEISTLMAANGYGEIITNSLTKPIFSEKTKGFEAEKDVRILNELSEDLSVLRQSLLFSALEIIRYNISHKQKNLKFFEFGKTYCKKGGKYKESERLGLFITGNEEETNWIDNPKKTGFHSLLEMVNIILGKMGIDEYDSEPIEENLYDYGLKLKMNSGKEIATIGKVGSTSLKLGEINQELFFADINSEYLLNYKKEDLVYNDVSKYPEVKRDLSLVIDRNISFKSLQKVALGHQKSIIKRVNVFDVYQGDKIDSKKKAYALSFTLQDDRKTLSDKDIDRVMNKLITTYENNLGAIIRK